MSRKDIKKHIMAPGNRLVVVNDGVLVTFKPHQTEDKIPAGAVVIPGPQTRARFENGARMNEEALFEAEGFRLIGPDILVPFAALIDGEIFVVMGDEEVIYRTENFEAIPHAGGTYVIIFRNKDGQLACGREFPAAVAPMVVEAIEAGFCHGVEMMQTSIAHGFPKFIELRTKSLAKGAHVQTITREVPTD